MENCEEKKYSYDQIFIIIGIHDTYHENYTTNHFHSHHLVPITKRTVDVLNLFSTRLTG